MRDEHRFWLRVRKTESCWYWQVRRQDAIWYGNFLYQGKRMKAHRLSMILSKGPIPESMWVLHTCDNPACVNPAHLYLGTHRDNMNDMKIRGRAKHHRTM